MIRKDIVCSNCHKEFVIVIDDEDSNEDISCTFCKDDIIELNNEEE
jgi:DNA-directed RNA polymerase subunit RPC12/RpoP